MLGLAVLSLALQRRADRGRSLATVLGVVAAAIGALLFAGSLADGGYASWPGLVAGIACAGLGYAASRAVFGGARRRLDAAAATLLTLYADLIALSLAVLAVLVPPLSFLALLAFAALLVRSRRARGRKFQGLRILR